MAMVEPGGAVQELLATGALFAAGALGETAGGWATAGAISRAAASRLDESLMAVRPGISVFPQSEQGKSYRKRFMVRIRGYGLAGGGGGRCGVSLRTMNS